MVGPYVKHFGKGTRLLPPWFVEATCKALLLVQTSGRLNAAKLNARPFCEACRLAEANKCQLSASLLGIQAPDVCVMQGDGRIGDKAIVDDPQGSMTCHLRYNNWIFHYP